MGRSMIFCLRLSFPRLHAQQQQKFSKQYRHTAFHKLMARARMVGGADITP